MSREIVGRRERRRERVRRELLDAAMALFAERGIQRTRVEDITERTDLGKGAFYNYFESKDALVAELVREGIAQLEADYLSKVGDVHAPEERLEQVVRAHAAFFEQHPHYVLLFHQARGVVLLERGAASAELRAAFGTYLERLGVALGGADEDVAAVLAGAVAGYGSFRVAAGARPEIATLASALTKGLAPMLPSRRAAP